MKAREGQGTGRGAGGGRGAVRGTCTGDLGRPLVADARVLRHHTELPLTATAEDGWRQSLRGVQGSAGVAQGPT